MPGGGSPQKKFQVEDLQKKMNKPRGKILQFIAESLKEKVLEDQQATYKVLKDSSKYIVECQQTG
jgi:hypothetical protein